MPIIPQMNPHLTFAAVLGCGLYGIKNKLKLTIPPLRTDASSTGSTSSTASSTTSAFQFERLPRNLQAATDKMLAANSMARQVLGDEFVDHFGATREHEWEKFMATVTGWEVERYLELA